MDDFRCPACGLVLDEQAGLLVPGCCPRCAANRRRQAVDRAREALATVRPWPRRPLDGHDRALVTRRRP